MFAAIIGRARTGGTHQPRRKAVVPALAVCGNRYRARVITSRFNVVIAFVAVGCWTVSTVEIHHHHDCGRWVEFLLQYSIQIEKRGHLALWRS